MISALFAAVNAPAQVPRIDPITPSSGHVGDAITISGANFSATPSANIVRFGAVRAVVSVASPTSLAVSVPPGATFAPVTVNVAGLTAYGPAPFDVRFNSSGIVDTRSAAPPVNFPSEQGDVSAAAIADIDDDGKPDVIVANRSSHSISVFRNMTTIGAINGSSLGSKVDFSDLSMQSAPDGPVCIAIADLDGDGRLDVIVAEPGGGTLFVFRNSSQSPGISFDSPVALSGGCGGGGIAIAVADLDLDGKPDIVAVDYCSRTVNILRNISSPGSLDAGSFAPAVSFPGNPASTKNSGVAIADLDGDGLPDIGVSTSDGSSYSSLLRNRSTIGNILFDPGVDQPNLPPLAGIVLVDLNGDHVPDIAATRDLPAILDQGNSADGYGPLIVQQHTTGASGFSAFDLPAMFGPGLDDFGDAFVITRLLTVGDFNGDGRADLIAASGGTHGTSLGDFSPGVWVYQNLTPSAPGLNPASISTGAGFPAATQLDGNRWVALGDLDGDGRPELVTGYPNGGFISVYQNTVAPCVPAILRSVDSPDGLGIHVCFDQTLDLQSAQDPRHYTVNNGAVTVSSATLNPDGRSVTLAVSGLSTTPNTLFAVTASGVGNACPEPLAGGGSASGLVSPAFQTLKSFGDLKKYGGPPGGLTLGPDGAFYGTAGAISVFKVTPTGGGGWTYNVIHDFVVGESVLPVGTLTVGADGTIYGMAEYMETPAGHAGQGNIYKLTPDGTGGYTYHLLHSFNVIDGVAPSSGQIVIGADGSLYGAVPGGDANVGGWGVIFRMNPDGSGYTVLHDFALADGAIPTGVILANDGALYGGTTGGGGAYGHGTIFRMTLAGQFTIIHNVQTSDGVGVTGLIQGADNFLYGTMISVIGGGNGGTVFRLGLDGTGFTVLRVLQAADGQQPWWPPWYLADGSLVGSCAMGGSYGAGTLFQIKPNGDFSVLRNFDNNSAEGYSPARVIQAQDGRVYGTLTTAHNNNGSVYSIDPSGSGFTVIQYLNFSGGDGAVPTAGLLQGKDGALYGCTARGGLFSLGSLFKINTDGTGSQVLRSFSDRDGGGAGPLSTLVQGPDGVLYGTTLQAGANGRSTIFKINPDGSGFSVLRTLTPNPEGFALSSGLIFGSDGTLYGAADQQGAGGSGTLFRITTEGATFTLLKTFHGSDGLNPRSTLLQAIDGYLYGTTVYGGSANQGTLFRIQLNGGNFSVVHEFGLSPADAVNPLGALIQGPDTTLYGITQAGGKDNVGTVFKIKPDGSGYAILRSLSDCEGSRPTGGLLLGPDGALYGKTSSGGLQRGAGTIFKFNTDGTGFQVLHEFAQNPAYVGNPVFQHGALMVASDGLLYGTTYDGGALGYGTIFRMDIGPALVSGSSIPINTPGFLNSGSVNVGQNGSLTVNTGVLGIGNNGTLTGGTGVGSLTVANGAFNALTVRVGSVAGGVGSVTIGAGAVVNVNALQLAGVDAATTMMVKDIYPGPAGSYPGPWLSDLNSSVVFPAYDGVVRANPPQELWKSDGSAGGTALMAFVPHDPFVNSAPNPAKHSASMSTAPPNQVNMNGTLYFQDRIAMQDDTDGSWFDQPGALLKTDGTTAGSGLVMGAPIHAAGLVSVGGLLFFAGGDNSRFPASNLGLWKYDPSTATSTLVKDINPGGSAEPSDLANVNGTLFFAAINPLYGYELWKSDGTSAGTKLVRDINPGSASSRPFGMINVNGTVFFAADDGIHGYELWKSDGTISGTVMVKDINPGAPGSIYPGPGGNFTAPLLVNVAGTVYFLANDSVHGLELWKSDGTAKGTVLVQDIYPGLGTAFFGGGTTYCVIDRTLFFVADDGVHGFELWKTDGTSAGTMLVNDINPGSGGSIPADMANIGGVLYFSADDGQVGREVWKSDGTGPGTVLSEDVNPGPASSNPKSFTEVGGTVFFVADDGVHGPELWKREKPIPTGALLVSAGTLNIGPGQLQVGAAGAGQANVSGGSVQAAGITVGGSAGSQGSLNISGGSINVSGGVTLAPAAANTVASITVSGGSLNVPNGTIAVGPVGAGQVTVSSGGTITAQQVKLGGTTSTSSGTLRIKTGGSVKVTGTGPAGAFARAAGLSSNDGEVEGGDLDCSGTSIVIGEDHDALFNVTSGTAITDEMLVGYTPGFMGSFTESGGAVAVTTDLIVGDCAAGTVGSVALGGGVLYVTNASHTAVLDVRNGTFLLSGGTLVVDRLILTNPCAHFKQTGGSLIVNYPVLLDPSLDADGDHIANGAEALAGTDPFDPDNRFVSVSSPSLATPLNQPGSDAVSIDVDNGVNPAPVTVSITTSSVNPTSAAPLNVGGGFATVTVTGADAADSAVASFYYPASVTGTAEAGLALIYFNGTIWTPVIGSGGGAPVKETTDNLPPSLVSGGRFTVTFDNTSAPRLTALAGIVFTMAVPDVTAPAIHCPANTVAANEAGQCSAAVSFTATATDNSGGANVVCNPVSGFRFAKGTTTVNCAATDGSGNQASCSFTVTVKDTEGPTIHCPANIVQATAPGQCNAVVSFIATAADNCPGVTASCTPASGSTFGKGTTSVTCRATDASGNSTSCSFTVTINDTEAPRITCPANITAQTDCSGAKVVTFATPTATDNCGAPSIACVPASGSTFPLGTTPVTCTATDASGNHAACSFNVIVSFSPANCQALSADLEKSKVHFHHDGARYAEFKGGITLLNGRIPTDFRGGTLVAQGRIKVFFGNSTIPAYCNDHLSFSVKDVDVNEDKEKWEFNVSNQQKISYQWNSHESYNANVDPALPASVGQFASQFIHTSESELRFDFKNATLPVTITLNGKVLVTVASKTSVTSPYSADVHGQKVDVLWPARLVPGDVVRWYADGNASDGLTGLIYTQTIGSGTAAQTYYNAGGNFDIRVPISGVNITALPRTATVQIVIGPSSTTATPLSGCATFSVPACDTEGDDHWQFNDHDVD